MGLVRGEQLRRPDPSVPEHPAGTQPCGATSHIPSVESIKDAIGPVAVLQENNTKAVAPDSCSPYLWSKSSVLNSNSPDDYQGEPVMNAELDKL